MPIKVKQHYRNVNGKLVLVHEHEHKGEKHFHIDDEFDNLPDPEPAPHVKHAVDTSSIDDEFDNLPDYSAVDSEFDSLPDDAPEAPEAQVKKPEGQHPVEALVKMPDGTAVTWADGTTITKKGDKLAYTGPYKWQVKKAIKDIPGRKWDPDNHSWMVPMDGAPALAAIMEEHCGDAVDITLPSKAKEPEAPAPAPELAVGEKVPFAQLHIGMKLTGQMTGKPLTITGLGADFVQYEKTDEDGATSTLQSDAGEWPKKHYIYAGDAEHEFTPKPGEHVNFKNLKPGMILTGNVTTTLKVHIDSINGKSVTYTKSYSDDSTDTITLTRNEDDWNGYTYVYANDQTKPGSEKAPDFNADGLIVGKEPAFDKLKPGMVLTRPGTNERQLIVDNTGDYLISQMPNGAFYATPKSSWDSHPGIYTLQALDASDFHNESLDDKLTVGDTKEINGVYYQLNANHRWERMNPQPDSQQAAPAPVVASNTQNQLENLGSWDNVTINGVKLYKQGGGLYVVYKTDADGNPLKAGVKQAIAGIAGPWKKQKLWYVPASEVEKLAAIIDGKDAIKAKKAPAKPKPKVAQAQIASGFPFTKLSGPQGSNPGGLYEDKFGKKWYIKFPKTEDHAKNEYLANKLYLGMGFDVPKVKLVKEGDTVGIASLYVEGLKNVGADLAKVPGAIEGFGADAWLCNWDSVGETHDNMLVDSDGKAIRVDPGGAMIYRAQGTPKAADEFGNTVPEVDTLRNGKNKQTASVFGKMTKEQIDESVAKVLVLDDDDILKACQKWGPGSEAEREALAKKLIARKAYLAKRFPGADAIANPPAPDPKHLPVDPSSIPPKVNFSSYHPDGKPLSSKQWKNDANQKVFDELYACAMKGDLEAFKDFKYMSIDPDTGAELGMKAMSNDGHPNKDISTFYGSCVGMLETIAYPSGKKVSSWLTEDAEDVHGMSEAFPGHPFGTTVDKVSHEKRLGFWISLGNVDGPEQFVPGSKANVSQALKDSGKQDYNKMSSNLRSWLGSVQGSGSSNIGDHAYNTGQSQKKLVQEAYDKATEFPEGTTIRRYLSVDPSMMKLLQTAPDGHIFQNPRSMCCSMNPKWEDKGSKWGNVCLEMVYAKGAKGLATYGSGSFMNGKNDSMDEQEITSLPGQRYMIINKGTASPSGKPKYQLLVLPPDPSYVADLNS